MLPLTKRQREILDYLNEFIQQHGYAPSLEEELDSLPAGTGRDANKWFV